MFSPTVSLPQRCICRSPIQLHVCRHSCGITFVFKCSAGLNSNIQNSISGLGHVPVSPVALPVGPLSSCQSHTSVPLLSPKPACQLPLPHQGPRVILSPSFSASDPPVSLPSLFPDSASRHGLFATRRRAPAGSPSLPAPVEP
jgi:hypothetical protein